jgi:hypothetical protein
MRGCRTFCAKAQAASAVRASALDVFACAHGCQESPGVRTTTLQSPRCTGRRFTPQVPRLLRVRRVPALASTGSGSCTRRSMPSRSATVGSHPRARSFALSARVSAT